MIKLSLLFSLVFVVGSAFSQMGQNVYQSETGKLHYSVEHGKNRIDYKLIFADFGKKQSITTESEASSMHTRAKTIILPSTLLVVNYDDKQVIKTPFTPEDFGQKMEEYNAVNQFNMAGEAMKEKGKASKEMYKGKNCDVYTVDEGGFKGRFWIWEGYVIKGETIDDSGNHTFIEMEDMELDVAIDPSEFEAPEGFSVIDMGDMMKKLQDMQKLYGIPVDDE